MSLATAQRRETSVAVSSQRKVAPTRQSPSRRKRWLRWTVLVAIAALVLAAYVTEDHRRTLNSLRRIPGTNAYVMDYYVDYHVDQLREDGIDIHNIGDSFVEALLPDLPESAARQVKDEFLSIGVDVLETDAHRCSTVVSRAEGADVVFGRNFDWQHDACLILKIHDDDGVASIAVIDLAYLKLNRADLEETNLLQRIPLLFAPYYLMDGMNRHGVAVSDMAVRGAEAPYDPTKPDLLLSTAMRLILDDATTTGQAIEILRAYNLHFVETTCHLLIADAQGDSAVVEFIDGQLTCTHASQPWQVCTNHCIAGNSEVENDRHCRRYRRASDRLAALESPADGDEVMDIMQSVSVENWTMWTSVYNLSTGEMRFAYRRQFDSAHQEQLERAE